MDKLEEKLLDILREEVLKQEGEDAQKITLKEYRKLIRLAKEHTVLGIVANAVCYNRMHLTVSDEQESLRKQTVLGLMQYHMFHKKQYQRFEHAISVFVGKQLNMCKTMPQITHTGANRQNQRLLHFFRERL